MKNIKLTLIVMFSVILFVSCDSATTQDLTPIVPTPTYTANVEAIFAANCTGCHAGGNQYPDLDTYAAVKDATLNGNILCRLTASCGNIMPQSGALPQATITMINTWATNNCPE